MPMEKPDLNSGDEGNKDKKESIEEPHYEEAIVKGVDLRAGWNERRKQHEIRFIQIDTEKKYALESIEKAIKNRQGGNFDVSAEIARKAVIEAAKEIIKISDDIKDTDLARKVMEKAKEIALENARKKDKGLPGGAPLANADPYEVSLKVEEFVKTLKNS
ncbi:MAG: hypothetical protein CEN90_264 [Parcubacteria group bacterium Licking1014_17]|nr:MAG: hypothetical protein CEN90_264 [Parcubacteria group bacterium Licking1014_17]